MSSTSSLRVRTAERSRGSEPSEDRIFQSSNAVIVLDGATQAFSLERSGGWLAETLGQELIQSLGREPNKDLRRLLAHAISDVARQYELEPGKSPSTTVSIVRFNKDSIDILVLCDSPVVLLDTSGKIHEFRDDRLSKVSQSLPRPDGTRNMGDRAWIKRMQTFESHRNQPDGFWVASASPEVADHATIQQFQMADIQSLLMMTDGVSAAVDRYNILPSWHEAIAIASDDPRRFIDFVHDAELGDPEAHRWPRDKIHDDKAIAIVEVGA